VDRFREDPVFVNEVKSPKGAVGLPQNSHIPVVQSLLGSLRTTPVFFLRLGVYSYLKSVELLVLMVGFQELGCVNRATNLV
jgi:hypothetical protein